MRVERVDAATEELTNLEGAAWGRVASEQVVMSPTPLNMQPTDYVRVSREGRPYGEVSSVDVRALHNGDAIFFRLGWKDETEDDAPKDINQFSDAAAVIFPVNGQAPLFGMGIEGKPVNIWLWRADWERPSNVAAEGMGTTQRRDDPVLAASARYGGGRWDIVVGRSFATDGSPPGTVALVPGNATQIGFAIWQGSNDERSGIKAFSPTWHELALDA